MTAKHTKAPLDSKLEAAKSASDWPLLIRMCRQALRKNPRHLRALRLLGFALNAQDDREGALVAFRQAAALLPNDAELLVNYANLLMTLGRNHDALPILEKVVALRPDHSTCWSRMAQCCYLMNRNQQGFDASGGFVEAMRQQGHFVVAIDSRSGIELALPPALNAALQAR